MVAGAPNNKGPLLPDAAMSAKLGEEELSEKSPANGFHLVESSGTSFTSVAVFTSASVPANLDCSFSSPVGFTLLVEETSPSVSLSHPLQPGQGGLFS